MLRMMPRQPHCDTPTLQRRRLRLRGGTFLAKVTQWGKTHFIMDTNSQKPVFRVWSLQSGTLNSTRHSGNAQ